MSDDDKEFIRNSIEHIEQVLTRVREDFTRVEEKIKRLKAVHERLKARNNGTGYIDCAWPARDWYGDSDDELELYRAIEDIVWKIPE